MFGPVEQEFAAAAHVIKRRLRCSRSGGQPLETAGAVAAFDDGSGKFTIYVNGMLGMDQDLNHYNVNEYAGIESYTGGSTIPTIRAPIRKAFARRRGRGSPSGTSSGGRSAARSSRPRNG